MVYSTYLVNSKSNCELCIVLEGLLFVFVTLYGSQFYVTEDFIELVDNSPVVLNDVAIDGTNNNYIINVRIYRFKI